MIKNWRSIFSWKPMSYGGVSVGDRWGQSVDAPWATVLYVGPWDVSNPIVRDAKPLGKEVYEGYQLKPDDIVVAYRCPRFDNAMRLLDSFKKGWVKCSNMNAVSWKNPLNHVHVGERWVRRNRRDMEAEILYVGKYTSDNPIAYNSRSLDDKTIVYNGQVVVFKYRGMHSVIEPLRCGINGFLEEFRKVS
jgi:hypothetical protein